MSTTKQTGDRGEEAVAKELISRGYQIIDRNWKTKAAEIDIIAQKNSTIYFVEVKFRRSNYAGDGFDYITAGKLHHMQRAAALWVQTFEWAGEHELLAASVVGDNIEIRSVS